jgi:LPXTG-motif cell wall-anchored protein
MRAATTIAILAGVRTPRWLVTCMLLLGALALAVPAVTVASGGGSAGDQQYTDPFAGTSPGKSKAKTTTTTAPATSTPAATQPATSSAPPASTPAASATVTSSDASTPTATIASSTAGQLPHTGYDSWLAAVLGFVLVSGGLGLRARLHRT